MTVYSTDLTQVLATVRETLVQRVAPGLTDGGARLELGAVVEALDNLAERTSWDSIALADSIARTEELVAALGLTAASDGTLTVETLRQQRRRISERLADTYSAPGQVPGIVDAVSEFTGPDVRVQISTAMRHSLPD